MTRTLNWGPRTLEPFWPKMVSKRCLFENLENGKGHKKQTFYTSSALGPSKNAPPGAVLNKHEK